MTELQQWAKQWGDLASIAGVLLAAVGFVITIAGVWLSKRAAEQAKEAAEETRDSIARYDAIADLSAAIAIMEEIKRLQRNELWAVLPERYAELQRRLTAIKQSHAGLSDSERKNLEEAVETFAASEKRVDRALINHTTPANPAKLNDIVSGQIAQVHVVLLSLQQNKR